LTLYLAEKSTALGNTSSSLFVIKFTKMPVQSAVNLVFSEVSQKSHTTITVFFTRRVALVENECGGRPQLGSIRIAATSTTNESGRQKRQENQTSSTSVHISLCRYYRVAILCPRFFRADDFKPTLYTVYTCTIFL